MKVALVCVAKNEDYYLKEWLDYNQKLGFDKVILFQNDWRTDLEHPIMEKCVCDGPSVQVPLYNNVLHDNTIYDWIAFIDCDEFIVLKKHNNIKELIEKYKDETDVLALNWTIFGNMGKVSRENNSLLKTFTRRNVAADPHVKVIVNSRSGERMQLPHNTNGLMMDTGRHKFNGPYNFNGSLDIAYINHYYSKTKEDWEIRCKRGRADCNMFNELNEWDKSIDLNNDVEDLSAYNFLFGI
jgi:hypothetical protein